MNRVQAVAFIQPSVSHFNQSFSGNPQAVSVSTFASKNGFELVSQGVCGGEGLPLKDSSTLTSLVVRLIAEEGPKCILVDSTESLREEEAVLPLILFECTRNGIRVIACDSGKDLTDPSDWRIKTTSSVVKAFAQVEKKRVSRKLQEARAGIRATGKRCDGRKPFGSHPGEREMLDLILQMRKDRKTLADIAAGLESAGFRPRHGGRWDLSFISRVLSRTIAAEDGTDGTAKLEKGPA